MKKINQLFAIGLVGLTLTGCFGKSESNIQYLPCQQEKGEDWGFVDAKGNVFCKDKFKVDNVPSAVVGGYFYVAEEKGLYTLYKFDEKKPVPVIEELKYCGFVNNGLLPVTFPDSRISVVNTDGKELFTLDEVDHKSVVACSKSFYADGYLLIMTYSDDREYNYGLVDTKGNVVLKPIYSDMSYYSKDMIRVSKSEDGETNSYFINVKGEKNSLWKSDKDYRYVDGYMVLSEDERFVIYDMKGKELLKCKKSKVDGIAQIKNNMFVYRDEEGAYGLMDMKGEELIKAKYERMQITDNAIVALREEGKDWEVLNKKGESQKKLDYKYVVYLEGFAPIAIESDDKDYYVLNSKHEACNKNEIYNINFNSVTAREYFIYSDYFDYGKVIDAVTDLIVSGLHEKKIELGTNVTAIPALQVESASRYRYDYNYRVYRDYDRLYSLYADVHFNHCMTTDHYRTERVFQYSWYGYNYYSNERKYDHTSWNSSAKVDKVKFTIDVDGDNPSARAEKLLNSFKEAFGKKFEEITETYFTYEGHNIRLSNSYDEVYVEYN